MVLPLWPKDDPKGPTYPFLLSNLASPSAAHGAIDVSDLVTQILAT